MMVNKWCQKPQKLYEKLIWIPGSVLIFSLNTCLKYILDYKNTCFKHTLRVDDDDLYMTFRLF